MFIVKRSLSKVIISLLLAVLMMISVIPFSSNAAMTTADVTEAMNQLKNSAYPQSYYWCGGNIDSSLSYSGCGRPGCSCNSFNRAYQCQGFALYLAKRVVGSYPAYSLSSYRHGATSGSWKCYTKSAMGTQAFCALGLQPGDIVRAAYNSSYSSGHTAVVWKVENGAVYFAEVWGSVYSKINWGGFNYYSYSLADICSRYSYVALWRSSAILPSSGVCNHELVSNYEDMHPHREYTQCSKCMQIEYTGKFVKVDGCLCCEGTHSYIYSFEEEHPHYEVRYCELCDETNYTGKSQVSYGCHACLGLPYDMTLEISSYEASIGQSLDVRFSAKNAVGYTVTVKCDGTRLVESVATEENSCSFTPATVGDYTVTVTAVSPEGKVNSHTSEPVCVTAPLTSVTEEDGKYVFRYDMGLTETAAAAFAAERSMLLSEHHSDHFLCELNASSVVSRQVGATVYSYIPGDLSYYEMLDFCRYTESSFVFPDTAATNEILVSLCAESGHGGVMLAANDRAEEGVWVSEDGTVLEYTNWNPAYKGIADRTKNYLYMYPNGTWVDSAAKPEAAHGFVISKERSFGFSENEDGTLTLCELPLTEASELIIPDTFNGRNVTAIASGTFDGVAIDSLTIPASVTVIPDDAFDNADIGLFNIARGSLLENFFINKRFDYIYIMPFTDVKKGAWYYDSMFYCYSNDYVSGTSGTTFSPNVGCTREMFVAVLARVRNADTERYSEASSFSDVVPGKWYSASIEWAYQNGVTGGIGSGLFGLGQSVTREQIAVFLYNLDPMPEAEADMSSFEDAALVSEWAVDGLEWALSVGLMKGTSAATLEPKRTAMRTELCQMIYNYLNIVGK